jgi:ribosomal protein L20
VIDSKKEMTLFDRLCSLFFGYWNNNSTNFRCVHSESLSANQESFSSRNLSIIFFAIVIARGGAALRKPKSTGEKLNSGCVEAQTKRENMLLSPACTDGRAFTELTVPINSRVHDK